MKQPDVSKEMNQSLPHDSEWKKRNINSDSWTSESVNNRRSLETGKDGKVWDYDGTTQPM